MKTTFLGIVPSINEVFHNAMLPSVAPVQKVGTISGIAFAIGNVGGLLLMLFVLFAFAMPGSQLWAFLPDAPLFGDGLGLDSIDALEIAFAVAQKYGFKLRSDDERNGEIFASLNALTRHIAENRVS